MENYFIEGGGEGKGREENSARIHHEEGELYQRC